MQLGEWVRLFNVRDSKEFNELCEGCSDLCGAVPIGVGLDYCENSRSLSEFVSHDSCNVTNGGEIDFSPATPGCSAATRRRARRLMGPHKAS